MSAPLKGAAVAAFLAALALGVTACGGSSGGSTPSGSSAKAGEATEAGYFSAESPWNSPIESLPKSPHSAKMLELARRRQGVVELPDHKGYRSIERVARQGFSVNAERWAPLVVEAGGDGSLSTRMTCRQSKCAPSSEQIPATLLLPSGTTPDPSYDGWLSVIDRGKGVGYDFWRARREDDGSISYQFAKTWKLDGPGFSKPVSEEPVRAAGARGSGLPLFAGVIGPAELRTGEINHALAVSVPGLARGVYVQPASVTDGVGSPKSLPAGARLRLKDSALQSRPKGSARSSVEAILVALHKYGAIVVDRASVPTLYAAAGTPSSLLKEDELHWLKLKDFEVVSLPKVLKDPPSNHLGQEGLSTTVSAPVGGGGGG
jgi:hypothetical protein